MGKIGTQWSKTVRVQTHKSSREPKRCAPLLPYYGNCDIWEPNTVYCAPMKCNLTQAPQTAERGQSNPSQPSLTKRFQFLGMASCSI